MRLYVFTAKKLITNILGILALIMLVGLNYNNSQSVFQQGSTKELPIYCVDTDKKVCALTFDAAWGAEDTDTLIEILGKYDAKATFFIVGEWADKYPDQVKKLHNAGHDIMNHSNTHQYMTKINNSQLIDEVEKCSEKIEKLTGKKPNLFRPPYGDYNSDVVKKLTSMGYYTIQWNIDSLDWQDLSADEIYKRVAERAENGSIILFHNAAKNTPEALPRIIEKLKEDGYEFKKVSEIIYKKNFYIDNTGKQFKIKKEQKDSPEI